MDTSFASDMIQKYVNGDSGYIGVITFFLCEAIFNAFPVQRARMKQLTSLLVGGGLGLFLLHNGTPADNLLQGLLAGGATTITVAKFKSYSVSVPPVSGVEAAAPVAPAPALPEPAEHL